jgi:hypothetical protein
MKSVELVLTAAVASYSAMVCSFGSQLSSLLTDDRYRANFRFPARDLSINLSPAHYWRRVMPDFLRRFGNCQDPLNPTQATCKVSHNLVACLELTSLLDSCMARRNCELSDIK